MNGFLASKVNHIAASKVRLASTPMQRNVHASFMMTTAIIARIKRPYWPQDDAFVDLGSARADRQRKSHDQVRFDTQQAVTGD